MVSWTVACLCNGMSIWGIYAQGAPLVMAFAMTWLGYVKWTDSWSSLSQASVDCICSLWAVSSGQFQSAFQDRDHQGTNLSCRSISSAPSHHVLWFSSLGFAFPLYPLPSTVWTAFLVSRDCRGVIYCSSVIYPFGSGHEASSRSSDEPNGLAPGFVKMLSFTFTNYYRLKQPRVCVLNFFPILFYFFSVPSKACPLGIWSITSKFRW